MRCGAASCRCYRRRCWPVPPWLAQQVLKIKMRGKVEDVQLTKEPVPFLVEPLDAPVEEVQRTGPPGRPGSERGEVASGLSACGLA